MTSLIPPLVHILASTCTSPIINPVPLSLHSPTPTTPSSHAPNSPLSPHSPSTTSAVVQMLHTPTHPPATLDTPTSSLTHVHTPEWITRLIVIECFSIMLHAPGIQQQLNSIHSSINSTKRELFTLTQRLEKVEDRHSQMEAHNRQLSHMVESMNESMGAGGGVDESITKWAEEQRANLANEVHKEKELYSHLCAVRGECDVKSTELRQLTDKLTSLTSHGDVIKQHLIDHDLISLALELVNDTDASVRCRVVELLSQIVDDHTSRSLTHTVIASKGLLSDHDWSVRCAAITFIRPMCEYVSRKPPRYDRMSGLEGCVGVSGPGDASIHSDGSSSVHSFSINRMPECVRALAKLIHDPVSDVCVASIHALGVCGNAAYPLRGVVATQQGHPCSEVRCAVAAFMGSAPSVPLTPIHSLCLGQYIWDANESVRAAALGSIRRIGSTSAALTIIPFIVTGLIPHSFTSHPAIHTSTSTTHITPPLTHPTPGVRAAACKAIGFMSEAVHSMEKEFDPPLSLKDVLSDVIAFDEASEVSRCAQEAMWRLGYSTVFIPELFDIIDSPSTSPEECVDALTQLIGCDPSHLMDYTESLAACLTHPEWVVRASVCRVIVHLPSTLIVRYVGGIEPLVDDVFEEVRECALECMAQVDVCTLPVDLDAFTGLHPGDHIPLIRRLVDKCAALVVSDEETSVRVSAVRCLDTYLKSVSGCVRKGRADLYTSNDVDVARLDVVKVLLREYVLNDRTAVRERIGEVIEWQRDPPIQTQVWRMLTSTARSGYVDDGLDDGDTLPKTVSESVRLDAIRMLSVVVTPQAVHSLPDDVIHDVRSLSTQLMTHDDVTVRTLASEIEAKLSSSSHTSTHQATHAATSKLDQTLTSIKSLMYDQTFTHKCLHPESCPLTLSGGRKLATHPHNLSFIVGDALKSGKVDEGYRDAYMRSMQRVLDVYNAAVSGELAAMDEEMHMSSHTPLSHHTPTRSNANADVIGEWAADELPRKLDQLHSYARQLKPDWRSVEGAKVYRKWTTSETVDALSKPKELHPQMEEVTLTLPPASTQSSNPLLSPLRSPSSPTRGLVPKRISLSPKENQLPPVILQLPPSCISEGATKGPRFSKNRVRTHPSIPF